MRNEFSIRSSFQNTCSHNRIVKKTTKTSAYYLALHTIKHHANQGGLKPSGEGQSLILLELVDIQWQGPQYYLKIQGTTLPKDCHTQPCLMHRLLITIPCSWKDKVIIWLLYNSTHYLHICKLHSNCWESPIPWVVLWQKFAFKDSNSFAQGSWQVLI